MKNVVVPPGTVFGHLTVIREVPRVCGDRAMLCLCECGTEKVLLLHRLRSGGARWCGCRGKEAAPTHLNPGEVPLYGKYARGRVALVDPEDFDLVMQYRWYVKETARPRRPDGPYATANPYRNGRQRMVYMHNLIMGQIGIDHIDGNGLNNRRSNLRPATSSQNGANRSPVQRHSSQFKGVSWYSPLGKWKASIRHNGRTRHLGYFHDEVKAAKVYDAAAREAFGEYARPNFPGAEAA